MAAWIDRFRSFDGWKTPITWIVRLLCGAVFLYSGFVKAIDPWGTLYKFEDYMAAWDLNVSVNLLLVGVFALCVYEFLVGAFLCLGAFRRSAPVMAVLFMALMLPLTLWIAVANPVADCGCFGDALILTNWQTFWKNVLLTGLVVWLILYNRSARCIIRPSMQWMALLASAGFVVAVGLIGYIYQPLIDFRPYPVGTTLAESEDDSEDDSDSYIFIYEKDGVKKSFTIDDRLPSEEDGWTFVERLTTSAHSTPIIRKDGEARESTFRVWSEDGSEDLTEEALSSDNDRLLLLMPELDKVSIATTWKINSLRSWAENHDLTMEAVVAATPQGIERWKDLALPEYPIYTAEDTEIKMLARGNPAVVYLRDGVIEWKSTLRALPNNDFLVDEADVDPISFKKDDRRTLYNIIGIYLAVIAAIAFISYIPAMTAFFTHGDKAHREELSSTDKSAQ